MKAQWDPSKSPAANMKSMGLVSNPGATDNSSTKKKQAVIQLYEVPESDSLDKKKHPLSNEDQKYICKCMAKHGTDYAKMFRDIKTNNMQYTESKLQKMGSRFLLLEEEQRIVPVPENAQALATYDRALS